MPAGALGDTVRLGLAVGLADGTEPCDGVKLMLAAAVGESVGVAEGVAVALDDGAPGVGSEVGDADDDELTDGLAVALADGVGVGVEEGEFVVDGVIESEPVEEAVAPGGRVDVGVAVDVAVRVAVGVEVGDADRVDDAEGGRADGVELGVALGGASKSVALPAKVTAAEEPPGEPTNATVPSALKAADAPNPLLNPTRSGAGSEPVSVQDAPREARVKT